MTTRERWIVYPLLIFSLMMGIKTRYYQDTFMLTAEKIECGDLSVKLINGRPVRLTAIIPNITPAVTNQPPDDTPTEDRPPADEAADESTGDETSRDGETNESETSGLGTNDTGTNDTETDNSENPPEAVEATESSDKPVSDDS